MGSTEEIILMQHKSVTRIMYLSRSKKCVLTPNDWGDTAEVAGIQVLVRILAIVQKAVLTDNKRTHVQKNHLEAKLDSLSRQKAGLRIVAIQHQHTIIITRHKFVILQ